MTLPWSPSQIEWLQAMGFEVLARPGSAGAERGDEAASRVGRAADADAPAGAGAPRALARAARGVDLAPLLAALGVPRDPASRRAFWRALRPLRKAARDR